MKSVNLKPKMEYLFCCGFVFYLWNILYKWNNKIPIKWSLYYLVSWFQKKTKKKKSCKKYVKLLWKSTKYIILFRGDSFFFLFIYVIRILDDRWISIVFSVCITGSATRKELKKKKTLALEWLYKNVTDNRNNI